MSVLGITSQIKEENIGLQLKERSVKVKSWIHPAHDGDYLKAIVNITVFSRYLLTRHSCRV